MCFGVPVLVDLAKTWSDDDFPYDTVFLPSPESEGQITITSHFINPKTGLINMLFLDPWLDVLPLALYLWLYKKRKQREEK